MLNCVHKSQYLNNAHATIIKLASWSKWRAIYVAKTTKCGSKTSPWRIETLPGQEVKITVVDFSSQKNGNDDDKSTDDVCEQPKG